MGRCCVILVVFLLMSMAFEGAEAGVIQSRHDFSFADCDAAPSIAPQSGLCSQKEPVVKVREPSQHEAPYACAICHTSQSYVNSPPSAPKWENPAMVSARFPFYASNATVSIEGIRDSSAICMGCHDGMMAGASVNIGLTSGEVPTFSQVTATDGPTGAVPSVSMGQFGHPVSVTYPLFSQARDYMMPPDFLNGWPDVPLYDGKVECQTCHNPHNGGERPFLRISNQRSALCLTCHRK